MLRLFTAGVKKRRGRSRHIWLRTRPTSYIPPPDATKGKLSHTAYRVLKDTKEFSLLEVNLLTGRKHQIRVHLAEIGHPVVGDEKYGKEKETYKRLALHAKSISFIHPFSGKRLAFETGFPEYFNKLVEIRNKERA